MSVATDSPVNSSSSDDFTALLEAELDSGSSDLSPDQDADKDDPDEHERYCCIFWCLYFTLFFVYVFQCDKYS